MPLFWDLHKKMIENKIITEKTKVWKIWFYFSLVKQLQAQQKKITVIFIEIVYKTGIDFYSTRVLFKVALQTSIAL